MGLPHICTEMPVPPELQGLANDLAYWESVSLSKVSRLNYTVRNQYGTELDVNYMWRPGRTLRVRILNGSEKVRAKVQQYAKIWEDHAEIKLDFVNSVDAEIRVNIDSSCASWSYVGTNSLAIPSREPTMNFGWLTDRTSETEFSRIIIHEFGHALGCIHEHQALSAKIPWNKPVVYDYYKKTLGWNKEKVDTNIFQRYDRSTMQSSAFDPSSIMLYAIPASLTTNGFSTQWNTRLSKADQSFIAKVYPGKWFDTPYFTSWQVRLPHLGPSKEFSKRVRFPTMFDTPPQMGLGLDSIIIFNGADIRVRAFADRVTNASADVHIKTWGDTKFHFGGCTWFTASTLRNNSFQVGQFSTEDDHPRSKPQMKTSRRINFAQAYTSPPKVIVWINQLDMACNRNWHVSATATNIDAKGFTIHLDSGPDTILFSAAAAWISYPADKLGVISGNYNLKNTETLDTSKPASSARCINFPVGMFHRAPKVMVAFNSLHVDCQYNLMLEVRADSVSKDEMQWSISWWDSIVYSAGASYIAIA